MTKQIDLNRVSFFKPVAGKTLREQLQGKKLAGLEVVDHIRSFSGKKFTQPAHWGSEIPWGVPSCSDSTWVYGFSLTYITIVPVRGDSIVNGFVWGSCGIGAHYRCFEGDILDVTVGNDGWCPRDWILIEL